MADLVDSYSESNCSCDVINEYSGNIVIAAQQFSCGANKTLWSAKFYLKKVGSPTGNIVFKLYSNSTGPGSVLATSETLDASNLTTSYALVELLFTGSNAISLSNGTTYWISCEYSGGSSGNSVVVGSDNTSSSYSGLFYYYFSGAWNSSVKNDYDLCFYVYAAGPVGAKGGLLLLNVG